MISITDIPHIITEFGKSTTDGLVAICNSCYSGFGEASAKLKDALSSLKPAEIFGLKDKCSELVTAAISGEDVTLKGAEMFSSLSSTHPELLQIISNFVDNPGEEE